jgi:exosortase
VDEQDRQPDQLDAEDCQSDVSGLARLKQIVREVWPKVVAIALRIVRSIWFKIGVIAVLLAGMNWWQFVKLVQQWLSDENWTHGFIIPLFSLFLLYTWRDEIARTPRRVCLWGLPVIAISLAMLVAGFYPLQNEWIKQLSMPLLIWGVVLYLAGWKMAKITAVPIFFLLFALPLPGYLYERIALPLQNLAARMSGGILRVLGVELEVTASYMAIVSVSGQTHDLQVAEACSGVRSMMAFFALGTALAYIEDRPMWQRVTMVVAALPITVVCNILRVTITSSMFVIDKPELGQEFMHTFTGMLLLIPALLLLFGLGKLLQAMVVEEEHDESDTDGGSDLDATDGEGKAQPSLTAMLED